VDAVLMPVGGDLYAVPTGWVREVVTAPALTPLVTGPAVVLGLFNLRGEIVPLVDTASLLGIGRIASVAFAVVLHTHLGPVGLSATGFPLRRQLEEPLGPSDLISGAEVHRVDGRVAVLLDVQALLGALTSSARPPATPEPSATALARHG
jgi:chemotaxis protein histidine kinase CheA